MEESNSVPTPTVETPSEPVQAEKTKPEESVNAEFKGNPQAVIAYIPFLFIIAALQRLDDDTLMFHAKNGAGLTLLFIVASFVSAWLHVLTGSILMLLFLTPAILGAYHGWKGEKWMIPGISSWAQNVPMEKWFREKHDENTNADEKLEPMDANSDNVNEASNIPEPPVEVTAEESVEIQTEISSEPSSDTTNDSTNTSNNNPNS